MNLPAAIFPSDWLWLSNALFAVWSLLALQRADWRGFLANATQTNALVALTFGAFLLWQINAGFRPGFNFHILGATLFLLLFGRHIASIALTLVMAGTWLRLEMDFLSFGLNGLVMIVLPVLFSDWMLRVAQKNLPRNLFVYVLLNGFVCGAIAIFLAVACASLLMLALTSHTWPSLVHNYLIATPIIMLTEAFTNGVMITSFVVFLPEAVGSFSDKDYIEGK